MHKKKIKCVALVNVSCGDSILVKSILHENDQQKGFHAAKVELRCGAVAVGRTYLLSASFVWRCLSGSTMTPFPHPAHRTGHADLPHPALGQDFTP